MDINRIRKFLEQILEIVELPEEQRQDTIEGIIELINQYVLVRLLGNLGSELQMEFQQLLEKQENKREFVLSFLDKYYTSYEIKLKVEEEAKGLVNDYLRTIAPLVSPERKEMIALLVESAFR